MLVTGDIVAGSVWPYTILSHLISLWGHETPVALPIQKNSSSSLALCHLAQTKGYVTETFQFVIDQVRADKVQIKPLKWKVSWEDLKIKRNHGTNKGKTSNKEAKDGLTSKLGEP